MERVSLPPACCSYRARKPIILLSSIYEQPEESGVPGIGKAGAAAPGASTAPAPLHWVTYGAEKRARARALTSQGRKRGMHVYFPFLS